jgi:hypothetical protein
MEVCSSIEMGAPGCHAFGSKYSVRILTILGGKSTPIYLFFLLFEPYFLRACPLTAAKAEGTLRLP